MSLSLSLMLGNGQVVAAGAGPAGPSAFSFTDITSAALSTSYTSAGVVLAGAGGPWAVTAGGGFTASINGGAHSASPGNASAGDTITARLTSSGSVSTAADNLVSVGTTSDTYTVTTVANAEASAYILRMATDPGQTRRGLVDTVFGSLKTGAVSGSNVYAKLDIVYLLAAHESATALLNLKGATYNATAGGGMGAGDFTTDRGYAGDAVAKYLDTNFADNTAAVNWSQDSAALGVWVNQESAGSTAVFVGVANASAQANIVPFQSPTTRARIHCSANATVTPGVANRLRWSSGVRSGSTACVAYRDTTAGSNLATASSAPTTVNIVIGRSNATFASDRAAAFALGGALTTNEHTDLYNALNVYLTAVGGA